MSKKLLSVLLAVLVFAMALPIGFAMAEDPTYTIAISDSKLINGFPATGNSTVDPGMSAADGIKYYIAANNVTLEYVEGTDGVRISSTASGTMCDINIRIKDTSFAEANMISVYVDATGAQGEGGFLYVRPCFNYASNKLGGDVARYFAAGHSFYFLEDGKTEAVKIDVAKKSSVWDVRAALFAGKKGTYFFPEECFTEYAEEVTGNAAPNNVVLPAGAWTSFGDDHLINAANTWVMGADHDNYTQANFSLQSFWFPANDVIIIDDLKYVAATVTENVPAGPVANPNVPSVGKVDETAEDANDGKITGVDSTMEYRAEADADYTAITGTEITGLAPGKYYVRYAETAEYLASADVEVVIGEGAPASGGGEGGQGGSTPEVTAPEYDTEVNAEDFSAFEKNHNWTAQWGNFCIYSNSPDGAVTADQVAITNGRFVITPNSTAANGTRFTTEIYDIGDWKEKYEAFSFDLDTTGLTDGISLRPKFVGIYFEGNARTTFNVCTGDIYFVDEDGTVTKESFEEKPGEAAELYQWNIPADFKGTVIIPREAVVAEDTALHADYDKFAFQFEFLNWHEDDNGESISVDNIKYLYNGIKLDWAGEPYLTDDTITYGDNLELNVSVEDDEDTPLTVIWTFDEGDTTYWGTAVAAKNGVTNIKVDVDAYMLDAGDYEIWVMVAANFNWPDGTQVPTVTDATEDYYEIPFTVEPLEISGYEIILSQDSFSYDGTAKEPTVTLKKDGEEVPADAYSVAYSNNVNVGTATVTITDVQGGNYTVAGGSKNFAITPQALGGLTIELDEDTFDYDGTEKRPAVVVKKGNADVDPSEYVVAYTNNVDAGTATVTITDAEGGTYTVETTTADFTINPIDNDNVPTIAGQDETVKGKNDGIITGVDATMEYRAEGENTYTAVTGEEIKNLAPGTYYVRYAATNNHNASAEVSVVIAEGQPAPVPDMGVESFVLLAIALLVAAGAVAVISLKKRAIQ